jgi:ribose 5-phosphate isomerase B
MIIALASDHGGYELKEGLKAYLKDKYEVIDFGTNSKESVDYPDYALRVALAVQKGLAQYGIMIDGAGIGSAMVANKVPGIRASVCNDLYTAKNAREHNFANVLTLGSMVIGIGLAKQIVDVWLNTPWAMEVERHKRRVEKIMQVEKSFLGNKVEAISPVMNINLSSNVSNVSAASSQKNNLPRLLTVNEVENLVLNKGIKIIELEKGQILTPLARDLLKEKGVEIREE